MFFRTVSQQFGIALSTAHDCLTEFMDAMLAAMKDIVKMPATADEFRRLADTFYQYKYPNVVGAIDGTSINITVPDEHRIDYFTRKFTTAVNLTAVCDANKRYWSITVGYSGRCHDSHIFRCSSLGKDIFINKRIPQQYHILGDAAYGLHINVMSPYTGDDLPEWKQQHNDTHSSTRMAIERSFSDLKNRWLRLKTMRCELELANKIIATCCCLHNISLDFGDICPTERGRDNQGNHELNFINATTKRDAVSQHIANA
jgi:hypothetical protein